MHETQGKTYEKNNAKLYFKNELKNNEMKTKNNAVLQSKYGHR